MVPLPTPHLETAHCFPGSHAKAVTTWKQHVFVAGQPSLRRSIRLLQCNRIIGDVPNLRYASMA
jgi:hypothetical protein